MKTLLARGDRLASTREQLTLLNDSTPSLAALPKFGSRVASAGLDKLRAAGVEILQINLGKLCNQTCKHCHVDAGPERREIMTRQTLELCLAAARNHRIPTVDLTGGAPEMNPHFRWFVEELSKLGCKVMDRCNLTIILAGTAYRDLPEFFARHRVHVVSSLPYYEKGFTDGQRGENVFEKSVAALKLLNEAGYGREGTGLELDLVYNPAGAFLPAPQAQLEADFKRELERRHGIVFNRLYTITNMPISRFLEYLIASGNLEAYMEKLVGAFNPAAVPGVMCRNTISVGWDGALYDCDFNQMLEIPVRPAGRRHIREFGLAELADREINVDQHCYGCTAGAGSSCGGQTT